MNKRILAFSLSAMLLSSVALAACSSNDGPSGSTSTEKPDNGENNNSEPDNISPDSSGNNGGSDTGNSGSGNTGSDSGGSGSGSGSSSTSWQLVFEDNFGDTSDTSATEPNSEYWTLAPKGKDTWNRYMSESSDQAYQKGGYLYLIGELQNGEYLTGGIETRNKFDFTYGQVKCRARFLRHPQGNHTGIWMMPQTQPEAWPRYGEIDIMEHLNSENLIYSTVHYWDSESGEDGSSDKTASINIEEFNVYGVIWTEESVTFTLNGSPIFTYTNDNPDSTDFSYQYPFTRPFYLILSQSLGGAGTWEGAIDNSQLPAIFQIDWIKVWQKK